MANEEEESETVELSQVESLLDLIPVGGLREAASKLKLGVNRKSKKVEILPLLLEALRNKSKIESKRETISYLPMWDDCITAGTPYRWNGHVLAELTLIKREVAKLLDEYVKEFGSRILEICAGKASSAARSAESTAYSSRWHTRYGKDDVKFTHMRRLYADRGSCIDYKGREQLALDLEEHVFQLLAQKFKTTQVKFSKEPGRMNTGISFGPGWCVFVYLALKVAPE